MHQLIDGSAFLHRDGEFAWQVLQKIRRQDSHLQAGMAAGVDVSRFRCFLRIFKIHIFHNSSPQTNALALQRNEEYCRLDRE